MATKRTADPESSSGSSRSKKRKSGIDSKWSEDFPWILPVENGEGMMCSLCRKHSRRHPKIPIGRAVWVDLPCKTLQRNSLVKHGQGEPHKLAVKMEADLATSKRDGGIAMALQQVVSARRKAFFGALKCMYFLVKGEIAHTTNFLPLLELAKSLGASYLSDIQVGGNATYTSERFMQELIQCLGESVSGPLLVQVCQSPFFAFCIDETTDVSVNKELIVYVRYLVDGEVRTSFLRILELRNGMATTIVDVLVQLCADLDLDIVHHLCGLGSDGASVMLGRNNGVSKLLKDRVPFLVSNHCIAHRLALACGQAANEVSFLKQFKDIIDQLYRFYKYSPVRTAGLREIQEVLNDPSLKLTQAKDVRWLSHDRAVSHLRQCLPSVITSLEREAVERNNAEALGLVTFITKYKFIAALYMFSDVLPPLASLSRAFQRHNIDFTIVKPLVSGTKATVDALLLTPGEFYKSLPSVLVELEQYGVQQPDDTMIDHFKQRVYNTYLRTLSEHISARFPDMGLIEAFDIFNPCNIPHELSLQSQHGADMLEVLISQYGPHHVIETDLVKQELRIFNSVVAANHDLSSMTTPTLMSHLLKATEMSMMFPNLAKLAAIGLLLPMSTVDCERGFSTLFRVKTDLRNRLNNTTLNHLLMMSVEGPPHSDFPYDNACDLWASKRNRRISVQL